MIESLQSAHVAHERHVQRAHGVQLEELELRHAQMNAPEHVVRQAVGAQRAPIADAMLQNVPGVGQLGFVFPEDAEHLAVMTRCVVGFCLRHDDLVGQRARPRNSARTA